MGSLLAIAAAHAFLVQGQVHLTRLQEKISAEAVTNRELQDRVAQLEDPSQIINQAESQGLVAPAQIGDLPQVPLSPGATMRDGAVPVVGLSNRSTDASQRIAPTKQVRTPDKGLGGPRQGPSR
ncbi:MAG TPA: hypothetical protein VEJ87_11800 [Acidimicrobiales bacterium]|nr:hypothetical protein [Acidimicrobiales bacterium]